MTALEPAIGALFEQSAGVACGAARVASPGPREALASGRVRAAEPDTVKYRDERTLARAELERWIRQVR